MPIYVYLDWNIFNKIEKLDELSEDERDAYSSIKNIILYEKIVTPYSNAHMSDLARGYLKNPEFGKGHLSNITFLTNNLCIVQYWGESKATWHYRDPQEFLDSTIKESEGITKSFGELLYMDGEPLLNSMWSLQKMVMRLQPVDEKFKEIYKVEPVFNQMFPRTKVEMNMLAMCEDLFQFSTRIKTDYVLYRNFQKYLTQLRLKMPQYQKLLLKNQREVLALPQYLSWDKMVDDNVQKLKSTSPNAAYDRIVNEFTSTDLKGYSQDERFANMIDDALHTFYAAHCDYFVTIDKRCSDKAKKVYEKLKIKTIVVNPTEFTSAFTI